MTEVYGNKMFCSFSGGETSAYMTLRVRDNLKLFDDFVVAFCNTSAEDERTLIFVDKFSKHYGIDVVWLEAVVNPVNRKVTTHKIVNFNTAARQGEVFDAVCAKYGLPSKTFMHCTRELKLRPIQSFVKSLGWTRGSFKMCVGIRFDELDRQASDAIDAGVEYPLIRERITKQNIHRFWDDQPVRLNLPEHRGNCKHCHKKSFRKLYTLAVEDPTVFDLPHRLEQRYELQSDGYIRKMYRGGKTSKDIIREAANFTNLFSDTRYTPELDTNEGCGDSCEPFADY